MDQSVDWNNQSVPPLILSTFGSPSVNRNRSWGGSSLGAPSPGGSPGHSPRWGHEDAPVHEDAPILQEDGWAVIDSFFDEKGLAHQQLGSFNDFMAIQIQKCADNHPVIECRPQPTYDVDPENFGKVGEFLHHSPHMMWIRRTSGR